MVNISLNGDTAVFEVEGWDKLWAFKSSLEIPVAHIRNVYADPNCAMNWLDGFKLIGTSIPHIFRAGTFYMDGDFVFWDVLLLRDLISGISNLPRPINYRGNFRNTSRS